MTAPILTNIQKSQREYLVKILSYDNILNENHIRSNAIAFMLDDIKLFWLERLKIIEFELEELSKKHCCFLLSGAIYLDVSGYNHYYFKSLGDYHLLYDPLLKMDHLFRLPKEKIDVHEIHSYFSDVYNDTIRILANYNSQFYILPIRQIAVESEEDQVEFLNKSFLNFLSSAFDEKFTDQDEFVKKYNTYEEIEKDLVTFIREHLVLSEHDIDLPLREKVNSYIASQMGIKKLMRDKSEAQIFLLSIFSWFSQIVDVLSVCTRLRVTPFIRFNITFHYLALIMDIFADDAMLKSMIERTIIFYIFRTTIDKEHFENISFSDYYAKISKGKLLDSILDKMKRGEIDVFKEGPKKVELIIAEEFRNVI